MRVLITGASGFLGKECVKQFTNESYDVVTTDRSGKVDYIGDLAEVDFVASLPDVDIVVNCAAVQYVSKDIPLLFRKKYFRINNILSAKNLSSRYNNSNTHFIHVGTSMMYRQSGKDLYGISSDMAGEGVYSKSKIEAQAYIDEIQDSATVIPCIIGGEGREGLFRGFVTMMKKYGCVVFPGQGKHKIHMVHVTDVASLILKIALQRASGFFNAGAPDPLSIKQWIEEIKDELRINRVVSFSMPLLPMKCLSWLTCYRILAREQLLMLELPHVVSVDESLALGWKPKFSNARIARDIAIHISREKER